MDGLIWAGRWRSVSEVEEEEEEVQCFLSLTVLSSPLVGALRETS